MMYEYYSSVMFLVVFRSDVNYRSDVAMLLHVNDSASWSFGIFISCLGRLAVGVSKDNPEKQNQKGQNKFCCFHSTKFN
jgi:hypothetical protein